MSETSFSDLVTREVPGDWEYPYFSSLQESLQSLFFPRLLPSWIQSIEYRPGDILVQLRSPRFLLPALYFICNHSGLRFTSLLDLYATDYPRHFRRFELSYRLRNCLRTAAYRRPGKFWNRSFNLSYVFADSDCFKLSLPYDFALPVTHPQWIPFSLESPTATYHPYLGTITVRVSIFPEDIVPSVISLYKSAQWLEREIWDLYGIYFSNNRDLRRILTDYGFEGFPLRKDFPLTGYLEVRYDHDARRVVLEPVSFSFGQEYRYFEFSNPWEPGRRKTSIIT